MKSVYNTIKKMTDLQNYNKKDKNDILFHIYNYLLGNTKYNTAKKHLKEYWLHTQLPKILNAFSEKKINYILNDLRNYNPLYNDEKPLYLVGETKSTEVPSLNDVLKNVYPKIMTMSYKVSPPDMEDRHDVLRLLEYKVISAYKIYIYSYNTLLNKPTFFSCIQKAIKSGANDIGRKTAKQESTFVSLENVAEIPTMSVEDYVMLKELTS